MAFQSTLQRDLAALRLPPIGAKMSHDTSLNIRVNGEDRRVERGITIAAMVNILGQDPAKVAVERNLEIVPRSLLGRVNVEEGDNFEIVHFVGGG